jgi:hypothetical protein
MSDALVLILMCGAFPAFFVGGHCIGAFLSGWTEMARRFPDRSPMPRARASTSVRFGRDFMYLSRDAVIGVDEAGLHLRQNLAGRLCHPPLLFPWPTVDARPPITFWFKPWDVYGVGYLTAIAVPQRSRAAALLRDHVKAHAEAGDR